MFSVVFVCTGNICRSPMASALLEFRLRELGSKPVQVTSMGVHGLDREPPTPPAVQVCSEGGLDISMHRSRPLAIDELERADLIFAMEMVQKEFITLFIPQTQSRAFLLGSWPADDSGRANIADPIGRSIKVYRAIFGVIKGHVQRIAPIIAGLT